MAVAILVRADLAPRLIETGRTLVTSLDSQGTEFEAAFWLMNEENGRWHLVLSSKSVGFGGSQAMYLAVDRLLSALDLQDDIWIGMISIIGHRTPIVKALRKAVGMPDSVDGVRLTDAFIGNVWIPACVLYRLSRRQKLKPATPEVRK